MDGDLSGVFLPAITSVFESDILTYAIAGIAAYWVGIIVLRRLDLLPQSVGAQGPILTIHTTRGRETLQRMSGPKRFWRAMANIGVGISIVVMASMFAFLLLSAYGALRAPEPTAVQQPRNVLIIPGINDFLPLTAAPGIVIGLIVGLVVHEGGHGLLCRVEDIGIKSMGLAMFALIPIGAFVEPDEASQRNATRGAQTRMFAAGVTANFAVTIVVFALLFGPIAGAIAIAPGASIAGVAADTPASEAGIEVGDRITAIDGIAVANNSAYERVLEGVEAQEVTVEVNGERTTTVERQLLVGATVENGPTELRLGDRIVGVNGETVWSVAMFEEVIGTDDFVSVTVERQENDDRETMDIPIGASTVIVDDGPLATAGAPPQQSFVITQFDGERVTQFDDLEALLELTEPDQTVTVSGYHGTVSAEYEVVLDEHPREDIGFLGIRGQPGVSGLELTELGVDLYPAEEYLIALGGDGDGTFGSLADSFLGKMVIVLFLPIIGFIGILPFNFAGFTGGVEQFYEVQGTLAMFGDTTVFFIANVLFWTGWINVQLGLFNCIPAFPLDGGHILRTSTEAVLSRLPVDITASTVRIVTTTIGVTMLVSFLLLLFGPGLLSG